MVGRVFVASSELIDFAHASIADIRLLTRSVGRSQLLVKGLGSFDAIWERARTQLNLSHDGIVDT